MRYLDLDAGTIEYTDTGGARPVVVFLHGVNMDGTLWRHVVAGLAPDYRCICPTLPLGSHRQPMRRGDLVTHTGVADMVGDLLDALDLRDVTLVLNDWGGAQFLLAQRGTDRIARVALIACEAFDNFPPGKPGKAIATAARYPAVLWLSMQLQRFGWFRRLPGGWGWMSRRPIPKKVMDGWFRPAITDAGVRRDLRTFALSTPSRAELDRLTADLRSVQVPVLVAWATEDKLMPTEHGPKLAELFPRGRLVWIDDSYTLVPEDQPQRLVAELRRFIASEVDAR
ncbi:alpha/beta fold hydrolase [Mycobacterium sp. pV006]|uniref:alpha/beta fold hydrolase n=1 Tax=Mycobacterium sp. pV006 TaxID=3238983 RepID=UPI00351B3180